MKGKLRSSDLAVAAAACVVSWLLLRTALRLEVSGSVVGAAASYGIALAARSRVGEARRDDVEVPLVGYLVGLVVVRAFEAESYADRAASARTILSVTTVALGALLGARRGSSAVFASLAAVAVALSSTLGASAAALSALWLLTLARIVARFASALGPLRLSPLTLVVTIAAGAWATRGATIGPLSLLVGLAGAPGGLETDPAVDSRRSLALELLVFSLASGAIVLARAWERSALVFL